MKVFVTAAGIFALSFALLCKADPPPHVVPPAPDNPGAYQPMPMPKQLPVEPPPPPPGQPAPNPSIRNEDAFVQAYGDRHNPRIMVFVNRNASGDKETTSDGHKYDSIGASETDYDTIEASLVKYFDNSGKVYVQDHSAAKNKLQHEQLLRVENGDAQAVRLLATELQQDILISITATPTNHSDHGPAVRIVAKAVNTTDARSLGTAFVDMPLPMAKQTINVYTRYLAGELMGEMTKKWAGVNGAASAVEIRIYKTASVDDSLKIRKWIQATRGVGRVDTISVTGTDKSAYAAFRVAYTGAPEDLYADLKDAIGASEGLKAVDVQKTTINLEVTGQLNLVTTTRKTETTTTTTTNVIEDKKIEPINPAPPQ